MSTQWYYVDGSGATVGPVSESVLANAYKGGTINDESYVWNGTTVNDWKAIGAVSGLSAKLKPKPKPKPKPVAAKPKPVAAKPKPAGGGGADPERNNLLAAIRAGKQLKKKPKREEAKQKPVAQMSLAEQMKLKLQQRGQGQPVRAKKKGTKKIGTKKPQSNAGKKPVKAAGKRKGGGRSGGGGALPYSLKNKIGNIKSDLGKLTASDEWKILAIEKILS